MYPELIVLVGISGSGKSTLAEILLEKDGYVHLSSDSIRKELFGDENSQEDNSKVFEVMLQRTRRNLRNGTSVVYDATNLNSKRRIGLLKALKDIDFYSTCCICMTNPYECAKRDQKRNRTVGAKVIGKQIRQFQLPLKQEGWNEIVLVRNSLKIDIRTIEKNMMSFDQLNPYHSLPLGQHCETAAHLLKQMKEVEFETFVAALYHDIGKIYTRQIDEKGIAHYPSHASVGAYYFLCSNVDEIIGMDEDDLLKVAFLINRHMDFYMRDKRSLDKLRKLMGENFFSQLKLLHEVDELAH